VNYVLSLPYEEFKSGDGIAPEMAVAAPAPPATAAAGGE
jgi:hypothetical protein